MQPSRRLSHLWSIQIVKLLLFAYSENIWFACKLRGVLCHKCYVIDALRSKSKNLVACYFRIGVAPAIRQWLRLLRGITKLTTSQILDALLQRLNFCSIPSILCISYRVFGSLSWVHSLVPRRHSVEISNKNRLSSSICAVRMFKTYDGFHSRWSKSGSILVD